MPVLINPAIVGPNTGTSNASGIALPGVVAGWTLLMANDFDTPFAAGGVSAAGDFPSPYNVEFWAYGDGAPDTAGSSFGANSIYHPSTVVSVSGSCLRKHVSVVGGVPHSATVGVSPAGLDSLYGRFSVCFRVPVTFSGWKAAWLHWPISGVWPRDGEIDFPEGGYDGNIEAYMHWQGGTSGGDQDGYTPGVPYGNGWHVATLEWLPSRCTFILDGVTIGNNTTTAHIPNTEMYWALQTETDFGAYPANMPISTDHGDIEIDWVAAWST
jgi:hypothetical protein